MEICEHINGERLVKDRGKDRGIEVLPLRRLKKSMSVITATVLSVAIWTLFAIITISVLRGRHDFMTLIVTALLGLFFVGSTTWNAICEWRKMRDANKIY